MIWYLILCYLRWKESTMEQNITNYKFLEHGDFQELTRKKCYDIAYMNMAIAVSRLSYAERAKVGSVLVSPSGQVISHGWNGTPAGMPNNCESWNEELGRMKTLECVIHSEANAILKCAGNGIPASGSTLYVTLSPCLDCAKMILQTGIRRVVYLEPYRSLEGIDFLTKQGVQCECVFNH